MQPLAPSFGLPVAGCLAHSAFPPPHHHPPTQQRRRRGDARPLRQADPRLGALAQPRRVPAPPAARRPRQDLRRTRRDVPARRRVQGRRCVLLLVAVACRLLPAACWRGGREGGAARAPLLSRSFCFQARCLTPTSAPLLSHTHTHKRTQSCCPTRSRRARASASSASARAAATGAATS